MLFALALLPSATRAQEEGAGEADARRAPVSFHRDVQPILRAHCQGCHQPARAEGDLDLTEHARILAGGRSGDTVVPGTPDRSLLIDEIIPWDGEPPSMPEEGEPLSEAQVEVIRRWIEQGARDDTPPSAAPSFGPDRPPTYRRPPVITSLDFSPDGRLLAVTGNHEVLLHQADGGGLVGRLIGLAERIESVKFSPDGRWLAVAGGAPAQSGELQIWDVESRHLRRSLSVTFDTLRGASWSPDGSLVAFGGADSSLRAVDARTGAEVLFQGAHSDWVLDTVFSSDASHLVSVSRDSSMKLTKVETQQFIDNITSITPGALKGGLIAVDRHPSRDELLVGGADGVPKIYKMYRDQKRVIGDDFNRIRAFEPMRGRVFDVAYSGDGTRAVAGSSHRGAGQLRVDQVEDGKVLVDVALPAAVYAVAFHPAGRQVAAGGFDGRVRLLDAATGDVQLEFVPVPLLQDSTEPTGRTSE